MKKNICKSVLILIMAGVFSSSFSAKPTYTVTLLSTPPTTVPTTGVIQLIYSINNAKRNNPLPVTGFTLPIGVTQGTTAIPPNTAPTIEVCAPGGSFTVPAGGSCALILNVNTVALGAADAPNICIAGSGCAVAMGANGQTNTSITVQTLTATATNNTPGVDGFAYVTNSGLENSVSLCAINKENGALFGCAATGNDFTGPLGVTFNHSHNFAYVSNASGSVSVCKVTSSSGVLSNCKPATNAFFPSSSGIVLNTANTFAYVTSYDNTPSGSVNLCKVTVSDGTLSACAPTGSDFNLPNGITLNTANSVAYVTNSLSFFPPTPGYLSTCSVDASTGALSGCSIQSGAGSFVQPFGIAIHKAGAHLYVSDAGTGPGLGSVSICDVSGLNISNCISTTAGGTLVNLNAPAGLTLSPDNSKLYLTSLADNTVTVCTVSTDGSTLSHCSTTGTGFDTPAGVALIPGTPGFPMVTCSLSDGTKTLMVAPVDNVAPNPGIQWYNGINIATGAMSHTDGSANTTKIITAQGNPLGTNYAANLCRNYNGGGFIDWYLPADDELRCLMQNSTTSNLGFATNNFYWTSTEDDAHAPLMNAFALFFFGSNTVGEAFRLKSSVSAVRCARAVSP